MGKVSIIGAGRTGSTIAQMMFGLEIADLVLLDVTEGVAHGKSLDILQSGPILNKKTSIIGTSDFFLTKDSDVVVITTGLPRKEGMTRDDLLKVNAKVVESMVSQVAKHSPNTVYVVLTNPLDAMAYLTMKVSGSSKEKVIGQSGILDSARMHYFAELETGNNKNIECCVLGGHGDEMVPLTSVSKVDGVTFDKFFTKDKLESIVTRTRSAGGEIISLLKDGSAYYAPAAACVKMIEAVINDSGVVLPCSSYLTGEYGLTDIFFGVPVQLGKSGIKKIIEYDLTPTEKDLIKKSAGSVKESSQSLKKVINF